MISGIINVYKEKGYTSHDVVARLRGILRQKKIGHTGTLDPDAEGVLPVCLGNGTKLCDLLTDKSKTYQAVLLLGQATDTQDTSGTVLEVRPVNVTEEEVSEAIRSFVGIQQQIPPMYSALKVNGKKLYELARAGIEVERKAREIEIYQIDIDSMDLPEVTFTVSCSKGTYIRTLCHDIGEKLQCGGCMKKLLRTRAGSFSVSDSLTLEQIEKLNSENRIQEIVYSVSDMFPDYPEMLVQKKAERLLYNGNALQAELFQNQTDTVEGKMIRVYDSEKQFCGIYRWNQRRMIFQPEKMFLPVSEK